jgi:hypothetical protein
MNEEDTTAGPWPETDSTPGAGDGGGTGDARVDAAVARLRDLADAPLDEHPAILGQVHDRLRTVLGELGPDGPGGAGGPGGESGPGGPGGGSGTA